MNHITKNKIPGSGKYDYEEIGEISETIAESLIIDANENVNDNIEKESIIEINNIRNSEELNEIKLKPINPLAIIDEFEIENVKKKSKLPDKNDSINIEKLSIQIDRFTSFSKKNKTIKSDQIKGKEKSESYNIDKAKDEESKISVKSLKIDTITNDEDQKETLIQNKETETEEKRAEVKETIRTLDTDEKNKSIHKEETIEIGEKDEITKNINNTLSKNQERNILSIEIPDKIFEKYPNNFNINEFGKIDLYEAEMIAGEDILSFAKEELLKELEVDISPGKAINIKSHEFASNIIDEKIILEESKNKKKSEGLAKLTYTQEDKEIELITRSATEQEGISKKKSINNETKSGIQISADIQLSDSSEEIEEETGNVNGSIDIIDTTITGNNYDANQTKIENKVEETTIIKNKPEEFILDSIPEEMELIENGLFNINQKKNDIIKIKTKITGSDQHRDDIIKNDQFKYFLPVPDSLGDIEKKSIENDITSSAALIFEEDIKKIQKRLEESMKNKIENTIQDITDRIKIYEENKNNNISNNKDDIKKLLKYLNDLFEKLPEETIKNFAESEYYDLYRKVLKDMDM